MGVGIWYEMRVNHPADYLFINANPDGSLQANVASSTISVLSNPEILDTVIEVMETECLLESGASIDILPDGASCLVQV